MRDFLAAIADLNNQHRADRLENLAAAKAKVIRLKRQMDGARAMFGSKAISLTDLPQQLAEAKEELRLLENK